MEVSSLWFILLYIFLLLSEFYYIYSCTTIITTWFYSISIPNPQRIPPSPSLFPLEAIFFPFSDFFSRSFVSCFLIFIVTSYLTALICRNPEKPGFMESLLLWWDLGWLLPSTLQYFWIGITSVNFQCRGPGSCSYDKCKSWSCVNAGWSMVRSTWRPFLADLWPKQVSLLRSLAGQVFPDTSFHWEYNFWGSCYHFAKWQYCWSFNNDVCILIH